ncbi:MAG: Sua5/YciO/YrdC/YwlC family protein [Gammaproteobacteria bacterium]|nr:Sua5/YciO/YrdC/YwlC family protein [Gammaproteobacteria bacterium]
MLSRISLNKAARILHDGGVIAYPTEGVFGLGCLPERADAVSRILRIKKRAAEKGLLLIASNLQQLTPWIELMDDVRIPASDAAAPVTWIVPATADAPAWLTGGRDTIAVRITGFAAAAALCEAAGSALVSTSANVSGSPPARNTHVLRRQFCSLVDYIVPGSCGPASGPSEIRDLVSGKVVRHASK